MSIPPPTVPIPTGWRTRFDPRPGFGRVRGSSVAIAQIVVAATAAYAFASSVLGHSAPLLAATVTVSSLGLVRDARPIRVLESVLGMLLGVFIAEILLQITGSGPWQLALALATGMAVARFVSPQVSFAMAAGIQCVIVMIIPTMAPFSRMMDAATGAVAALLATALIPRSAVKPARRDGVAALAAFDAAALTVVQGLRGGSRLRTERGLEKARALQSVMERWHASLDSAIAIARISPFLQRQRTELARQDRIRSHVELASRNLRVISRRASYLCDDGVARPEAAALLSDLALGARVLADSIVDLTAEPAARDTLAAVARRLDPVQVLPDATMGDQNLIAALRPLAVDLLVASGVTPEEARGAVPRI